MQQDISEPIFYGDKVYKFKKNFYKPILSEQLKKIINVIKKVVYTLDITRQSAHLAEIQPRFIEYVFLFNCTEVGQASDSMKALT